VLRPQVLIAGGKPPASRSGVLYFRFGVGQKILAGLRRSNNTPSNYLKNGCTFRKIPSLNLNCFFLHKYIILRFSELSN